MKFYHYRKDWLMIDFSTIFRFSIRRKYGKRKLKDSFIEIQRLMASNVLAFQLGRWIFALILWK